MACLDCDIIYHDFVSSGTFNSYDVDFENSYVMCLGFSSKGSENSVYFMVMDV